MMKLLRTAAFLLGTAVAVPVMAQDFDKGLAAYRAGDYATAVQEWRPLAEQGEAIAQVNLGFMYENGRGVLQDYAEAVRWYRMAAEQGNAWAQASLGFMYFGGRGVLQDYVLAHMWFNISAANGNAVGPEARSIIEELMTREQVADAQARARRCMSSYYQDCY